ncbi:uncharacterized protein LOC143288337 [Babylonia areolata]|uniref:uncharacterized protein LOC143288337 n=1 Tax=Babylonia areolata TaxID=304850 RepID=UPI003FCEF174
MAESKRSSNWGEKETLALLGEIAIGQEMLFSKLSNAITLAQKNRLWASIVNKVNATAGQNRDARACKKRWRDVKSTFLHHKNHASQTGGGKPAPTTPYDELIAQILGENTSLVSGITDVAESLPAGITAPSAKKDEGVVKSLPARINAAPATDNEGEETLEGTANDSAMAWELLDAPAPTPSASYRASTPTPTPSASFTSALSTSYNKASTPTPSHVQQAEADRPMPAHTSAQPTKKRKISTSFIQFMEDEESILTAEWLKSAIEKNRSQVEKNKAKQALCEALKIKTDLEIAQLRAHQQNQ